MNTPVDECTLTLTETNSRGYIPICSCGWTGHVHTNPAKKKGKPARQIDPQKYNIGKETARAEWRQHRQALGLRQAA